MSTATAASRSPGTSPSLLLTWRCVGCRRVVAKLQYDGRTVIEVKHHCNSWNRLPDDAHRLRAEGDR